MLQSRAIRDERHLVDQLSKQLQSERQQVRAACDYVTAIN